MSHPRIARREDAFLLVVDLQEPLLKVMHAPERLLDRCGILLRAARSLGLPIFATEQYPERFGPTVAVISEAWGSTTPAGKMAFSSIRCDDIHRKIKEIERRTAILCGLETHVCINQTAHDLLEAGYYVHVPADAVDSRSTDNWERGLAKMRYSGAIITSTEMVVYELLGEAGTPEFKALLPLLK